jgi:hypothetical protein
MGFSERTNGMGLQLQSSWVRPLSALSLDYPLRL